MVGASGTEGGAWISSLQICLLLGGGAVAGPLYDYGYLRALCGGGWFPVVLGMALLSVCTEFWQLILAYGITIGLGGACLLVPSLAFLSRPFHTRTTFAAGLIVSGGALGKYTALSLTMKPDMSTGALLYPFILNRLAESVSFGWALRALSLVVAITLAVPAGLLREPHRTSVELQFFSRSAWAVFFCLGGLLGYFLCYLACAWRSSQ